MSDALAATLITIGVFALAISVPYSRDTAKLAWTRLQHRKASQSRATLNAWPADVLPVCESWIGREISAPVVAEAEQIAAIAWNGWEMSPANEEGCDD